MSNDEFESWLSLVGRLLGLSEGQRKQISEELRDHLESRVVDLMESGMDRQAAVLKAVEEFGDAAVLAKNLQSVSLANRKRWMMRFMTLATAAMFLVAVLTMAMWPENARFGSPSQSVAQEDPFDKRSSDNPDPFGKNPKQQAAAKEKLGKPSPRSVSRSIIRKKLAENHDLVYDSDPFGDIRQELQDALKINIVVDANLAGVLDDDTEISANLTGIPLSDGLRLFLRRVDATYVIQRGVLLLISIDDEQEPDFLARHMIDVQEILQLIKETESDRVGKPLAFHGGGGGGGGLGGGGGGRRGGGGVFAIAPQGFGGGGRGDGAGEDESKAPEKPSVAQVNVPVLTAEELLVDTIQRVVSPDAWHQGGSGNADLTCIGGVLVVLSHESLAEEVEDFVVDLEYQLKNRE